MFLNIINLLPRIFGKHLILYPLDFQPFVSMTELQSCLLLWNTCQIVVFDDNSNNYKQRPFYFWYFRSKRSKQVLHCKTIYCLKNYLKNLLVFKYFWFIHVFVIIIFYLSTFVQQNAFIWVQVLLIYIYNFFLNKRTIMVFSPNAFAKQKRRIINTKMELYSDLKRKKYSVG